MPLILPNTIANGLPADGDKLDQNFRTITDWANQEAIVRDGSTAMQQPLLLPGAPTQPNQAATKAYVDSWVPVGVMFEYLGDVEPAGWMFARGQALSRATYAALCAIMGTKYGAGDGSTTFNLPSMQGRAPMGHWPGGTWAATNGALIGQADTSLPYHAHTGVDHLHGVPGANTSMQSNNHDHTVDWGEVFHYSQNPVDNVNVFDVRIGDGFTVRMEKFPSSSYPSSTNRQGHLHASAAVTTGAADRNLNTGAAGVSATNTNISPSTVLNFIVKVQ